MSTASSSPRTTSSPAFTLREALENPVRDVNRIVLPPASFLHEKEKLEQRWPAAVEFIKQRKLNEIFGPADGDGRHRSCSAACTIRRCARCNSSASPTSRARLRVPLYVLNVAYPLIEDEVVAFCAGKTAVLMVEEGAPDYHRAGLNTILRRRDIADAASAARTCCRWAANIPRRCC